MSRVIRLFDPYRNLPKEVYVIFLSRIINAMGCFVMPLMTLILTKKIGLPKETAGLYLSVAGLLFLPATWLGGKLADTIGRKIIIVVFGILGIVFYAICGFMEPSRNMIYVLMAAGASMSVAGPAHDSIMADITTPENRNGAYALSYMGWNLGFAIGPTIGGLMFEKHLPLVFWGDAATALISLGLIIVFIKETIHKTHEDVEDKSRIMEQREEGSIFAVLARRPILIYFAFIIFGYNFAYSQWTYMLPMHSAQNFESAGAVYYGFMASFNGFVVILLTPLITKMIENIYNMRKMVYGGLLYAFGFGMLGVLNTLPFFFVSVFVFTLGEIVLSVSIMPFIANHTPASHRGRMNAVLPTIMGMGYTLGPAVMGSLLPHTGIEKGWLILGIFVLFSSALMYLLELYEKKHTETSNLIEQEV